MRALDTNVVVRLFARDHSDQVAQAERLLSEEFVILPTVLLEAAWVLQARYRLGRHELALKLREFLGLDNAITISANEVRWAVDRFAEGADFADALHLALATEAGASSLATFDQRLARSGGDLLPVELIGPAKS